MKKFLKENKIFLAVIAGALIIAGAVWISSKEKGKNGSPPPPPPVQCLAPSEVLATKVIKIVEV